MYSWPFIYQLKTGYNMNIKPQNWTPLEKPQTAVLPARPNHPFFYKWHPSNWDFFYMDVKKTTGKGEKAKTTTVKKGFFVPSIRMERVVPGVNGIRQVAGEVGTPGSRIGSLQQKGWIYLDPQRFDYMHVYPVRGGRYHVPKWQNVKVVAGHLIEKMDMEAFRMWCVDLLQSNILGTPEPHFWELIIHRESKIPQKLINSQHLPEVKAKIDEINDKLKAMKAFKKEFETRGLDIYNDLRE